MWLPETGVYHYKARAYEPNLGRFLQTDPMGYDAGLNLYAYVRNDPVNATDPSGMFSEEFCDIMCSSSSAGYGGVASGGHSESNQAGAAAAVRPAPPATVSGSGLLGRFLSWVIGPATLPVTFGMTSDARGG